MIFSVIDIQPWMRGNRVGTSIVANCKYLYGELLQLVRFDK